MMRKIILVLFFLLFSSIETSYSKELKTIWGFSITIPENYIVEVTDFDLLMSKSRGSNVRDKYNLETYENLMKNAQISEKILIAMYEKDTINRNNNHINLNSQSDNIFLHLNDRNIYQHCMELKKLYSSLLKKEIIQYECFINNSKFQNLSSSIQLKHSHREGMLNYQYMVPHKRGFATFALLCENKNCDIMHEKLITIIRSLKN
jgi:hypothetical protein